MATKKAIRRARTKIEPRQPADPFAPFDAETYGCVLPGVALKKSCADMRRGRFFCPKWRAFKRIDGAGNMVGIDWACDEKWKLDIAAEQCGRLVSVQAAVETRGDRTAGLVANLNAQAERQIAAETRTADQIKRIADAAPIAIEAPADDRLRLQDHGSVQARLSGHNGAGSK